MAPFPADVQQSFTMSPTSSPMRTADQGDDPFAAFNAPNDNGAAPEAVQTPRFDDPWSSMVMGGSAPVAPMGVPPAVPTENPPPAPPAETGMNFGMTMEPASAVAQPNADDAASEASAESIPVQNYTAPAPAVVESVAAQPAFEPSPMPAAPAPIVAPMAMPEAPVPAPVTMPPPPALVEQPVAVPFPQPAVMPEENNNIPSTVVVPEEDANASPPSPISLAASTAPDNVPQMTMITMPPAPTTMQQQPTMQAPGPTMQQQMAQPDAFAMAPPPAPVQNMQNMAQPDPFTMAPPSAPVNDSAIASPVPTAGAADGLANQMNNLSVHSVASTAMPTAKPNNCPPVPPSDMPPAPPAMAPPQAPPSPPNVMNVSQQMQPPTQATQHPVQQQTNPFGNSIQAPLSPLSPVEMGVYNSDPFGYAFSPMASPTGNQTIQPGNANDMMGRLNAGQMPPVPPLGGSEVNNQSNNSNNGAANNAAMVPSNAPNADPWGVFGNAAPAQQQPPAANYMAPPVPPPQLQYQPPPPSPPQPQYQAPPVPEPQQQYQPPMQFGSTDALVPSAMPNNDPFGVGAPAPVANAMVPSNAHNLDPFGVFDQAPASQPADPFAGSSFVDNSAVVPAAPNQDDPFGIFGNAPAPAPEQVAPMTAAAAAPAVMAPPANDAQDPWAAAGFGTEQPAQQPVQQQPADTTSKTDYEETPIELDQNGLPKAGEYYEARINAPSLGAMFYTARDLEDTLLYHMPTNVIDAMESRPVVAYIAENSAAENNGVHLGHCVLSVNGTEVKTPEECAQVIRTSARPMILRCYVMPDLELSPAEGRHMVKYDKKDIGAPTSAVEWKAKYVVVGGIIAKPWMMNMYYSKKDYDTAVKETHMNFKCSVKVKQFDLRGARIILDDKNGKPNTIRYPSEQKVWYFITIIPHKGYPIKISSETLEGLEAVYSATRRFIRRDMEDRYRYEEKYGAPTKGGYQSAYASQAGY